MWPENYSANSSQKVWAAKFAAHHPNVVVLDLSSFKCGHDAPTYGIIDSIITTAGTPYSALHDIDANKPGGSIKIRVKTYAHSLSLHKERLEDVARPSTSWPTGSSASAWSCCAPKSASWPIGAPSTRRWRARSQRPSQKVQAYEEARAAKTEAEKAAERADALKKAGIVRLGIKRRRLRRHRQVVTGDDHGNRAQRRLTGFEAARRSDRRASAVRPTPAGARAGHGRRPGARSRRRSAPSWA